MRFTGVAVLTLAVFCLGSTESRADLQPYIQDFEQLAETSLDQPDQLALATDGWLVFGNTFFGGAGSFIYSYGPFSAPNGGFGGPAFCAVVPGEGGVDQGQRQLSVYSDYNNFDHTTSLIEANVFQEQIIGAADVGNTWRFAFQHKRGNIEGQTTALAFIKTIDPSTGFALTNFITVDMTNIPDTWGGSALSIFIDPSLEGQLLQFGFLNTATDFEGSGIVYDNVVFVREALVCGDSEPDAGEQCDDGNTNSGDGCSLNCQIEAGFTCTAAIAGMTGPPLTPPVPSVCTEIRDSDGDGVLDDVDNCTLVANADQRDSNGDGFGNICDADLDGDCLVTECPTGFNEPGCRTSNTDMGQLNVVFFGQDADADFNGDGTVNFFDLGIFNALVGLPPGPSALAQCPSPCVPIGAIEIGCDDGLDGDCDGLDDDQDPDCAPLVVDLASLYAVVTPEGVRLRWTTTLETDNLGFRVLRAKRDHSRSGAVDLQLLTTTLIPAQGSALAGADYEYIDAGVLKSGTVQYYLEDTDIAGRTTLHGPVFLDFRPARKPLTRKGR